MRPDEVPETAIQAALGVLEMSAPVDISEQTIAAMIAAAVTGTNAEKSAEDRDEWLATTVAQREHAETATRAILHQTDLIQQIVDKVLGIGNAPTEYELRRDSLMIAAAGSHMWPGGDLLFRRAAEVVSALSLGRKVPEADAAAVGPDPVVVEHGTHLEVTWRNGRGEWFLCSPEVIEGDVAMINELRATVRENGQAIAAALRIHKPCHGPGPWTILANACERFHYEPAEIPECIGCGYGSSDQTTEWPCATAQALGATR